MSWDIWDVNFAFLSSGLSHHNSKQQFTLGEWHSGMVRSLWIKRFLVWRADKLVQTLIILVKGFLVTVGSYAASAIIGNMDIGSVRLPPRQWPKVNLQKVNLQEKLEYLNTGLNITNCKQHCHRFKPGHLNFAWIQWSIQKLLMLCFVSKHNVMFWRSVYIYSFLLYVCSLHAQTRCWLRLANSIPNWML